MYMTGQKLHLQFLQGRSGGVAEAVRVEDERVENENQDDGTGPDEDMGEHPPCPPNPSDTLFGLI